MKIWERLGSRTTCARNVSALAGVAPSGQRMSFRWVLTFEELPRGSPVAMKTVKAPAATRMIVDSQSCSGIGTECHERVPSAILAL